MIWKEFADLSVFSWNAALTKLLFKTPLCYWKPRPIGPSPLGWRSNSFLKLFTRNTIFWFMLMFSRVQGPRKRMPYIQQPLDLQTINFRSWLQFYEIFYSQKLFFPLESNKWFFFPTVSIRCTHFPSNIIHRREHNFPIVFCSSWSKT